jgi:hypothetical protein
MLSVGSERVYFLSLLYPNTARVFVIDRSVEVVRFHKVNLSLLAASKNREDYLSLRFASNFEIWQERLSAQNSLSADDYNFWKKTVIEHKGFASLYRNLPTQYRMEVSEETKADQFRGVNYLESDSLFEQLKSRVLRGDFIVNPVDLSDEDSLLRFKQSLSERRSRFSVVDLSNIPTGPGHPALSEEYLSRAKLHSFLDFISSHSEADARLLFTRRRVLLGEKIDNPWEYINRPLAEVATKRDQVFPLSKPDKTLPDFLKSCWRALVAK